MTRFMTILSAVFSATVGVIIISLLGIMTLAIYKCVQAPPQTLEEKCREWAIDELETCESIAFRRSENGKENEERTKCLETHDVSKLMNQCMAGETSND